MCSSDFIPSHQVYNQLQIQEYYGYYYKGLDLEDDHKESCIPVTDTFFNGLYYLPVNVTNDGDVYAVFRVCLLNVSLIVLALHQLHKRGIRREESCRGITSQLFKPCSHNCSPLLGGRWILQKCLPYLKGSFTLPLHGLLFRLSPELRLVIFIVVEPTVG